MGFHVARIFHSFIITTKQAKYQRPIKRTWSFTTIKYSLFLSNRLCFSQNEHKIIIISLLNLPFFFSHVLSLSFPFIHYAQHNSLYAHISSAFGFMLGNLYGRISSYSYSEHKLYGHFLNISYILLLSYLNQCADFCSMFFFVSW